MEPTYRTYANVEVGNVEVGTVRNETEVNSKYFLLVV